MRNLGLTGTVPSTVETNGLNIDHDYNNNIYVSGQFYDTAIFGSITLLETSGNFFLAKMKSTTKIASVSITQTIGSNPTCAGQSVTFMASATNGGTAPVFQWKVGGTYQGTNSPTYTTSALTNGQVITCDMESNLPEAAGSVVTSNALTIIVNSTPPTPNISQAGATLTSSSADGNQWYLNGVPIPGATGQNYTLDINGNYTVIVTNNGCVSAESAPLYFTSVGLSEEENPYILNIYPNPNDGSFNVSFRAHEKSTYTLALQNALGQLIFKEVMTDFIGTYSKNLNVKEFGKGIFTISLTNSKKETVKKLIVN